MSDSLKIFCFYLIILFVIIISSSCNPVKQVLTNEKKFNIVAKEVVKRGYCVNDTIVIDSTKVDTFIHNSYVYDTLVLSNDIDTTFPSGASLVVKEGYISLKCPKKEIIKTVYKTNYIRDVKLENILKEENKNKSDSIASLFIVIKQKNETIQQQQIKIIKEKTKFIIFICVLILFSIIYLFYKFKSFR
jgi:hypothetical protein